MYIMTSYGTRFDESGLGHVQVALIPPRSRLYINQLRPHPSFIVALLTIYLLINIEKQRANTIFVSLYVFARSFYDHVDFGDCWKLSAIHYL